MECFRHEDTYFGTRHLLYQEESGEFGTLYVSLLECHALRELCSVFLYGEMFCFVIRI